MEIRILVNADLISISSAFEFSQTVAAGWKRLILQYLPLIKARYEKQFFEAG